MFTETRLHSVETGQRRFRRGNALGMTRSADAFVLRGERENIRPAADFSNFVEGNRIWERSAAMKGGFKPSRPESAKERIGVSGSNR